jgi:hypothetical protein
LAVLEFELKASCLLGRCSTTSATPPASKYDFYKTKYDPMFCLIFNRHKITLFQAGLGGGGACLYPALRKPRQEYLKFKANLATQ